MVGFVFSCSASHLYSFSYLYFTMFVILFQPVHVCTSSIRQNVLSKKNLTQYSIKCNIDKHLSLSESQVG